MSAVTCTCDAAHVTHVRTSPLSVFGEVEAWLAARPGETYLVGHGWHFDNEAAANVYAFGEDTGEVGGASLDSSAPGIDPALAVPAATLNELEALAAKVEYQEWKVWENTHCDPVVIPVGRTPFQAITDPNMPFKVVTGLSTSPSDYGRSNLQHIAGMDPAMTRKMIAYIRALEEALATKNQETA